MPHYLLSVVDDGTTRKRTPAEAEALDEGVGALNEELRRKGSWVFAGILTEPGMATTVDARGAEVAVVDGPFAESKEHLGGFWIVRAPDLDVALKIATRASRICGGRVEVRPFEVEPQGVE